MVKVTGRPINRVITVEAGNTEDLDRQVSELLDIIDSYGGSNPFPRFHTTSPGYVGNSISYFYSCTTKIGTENIIEFDEDIEKWRGRE